MEKNKDFSNEEVATRIFVISHGETENNFKIMHIIPMFFSQKLLEIIKILSLLIFK